MIHVVLLSGGSGTRLWPLSNNARSKQFLKVLRDADGKHVSMVQRVFEQIGNVDLDLDVTIATSETQAASLEMQVGGKYALVLEPERRDTAPAIMLACANLSHVQNADLNDTVVVMPIDTYADQQYYNQIGELDDAVQANETDMVLLGVRPTYPSEKYGYIIPETPDAPFSKVLQFREKPNAEQAEELIALGALWNCGVFAFKLGYLMNIVQSYVGQQEYAQILENYGQLPKNSFDYEVVEKTENIGVVPYLGKWKDLGTWNTLTEEMTDSCAGRVVIDENTCENVHVVNETMLPMVVSGVKNSVVIATHDGILVASKDASSNANMKSLISDASASRPMYERRLWGEYRVLDAAVYDGVKTLTKELIVESGKQLSYQKHASRSEIWTIVSGQGEVVIDGEVREVSSGDIVNVKIGNLHSIRAFDELHIIEVQLGQVLSESDIERFGNYWED